MNKYITSILCLLLLAGCSNDEQTESNVIMTQNSGRLIVTTEILQEDDGITRSYLSRDMQTRMYFTDDELRVYDNDLHKYDIYKFKWKDETHKTGVFSRSNPTTHITAAKWALFPKAGVSSGHWDLDEETGDSRTEAWILVAAEKAGNLINVVPIVYDGTYDANDTRKEKPLYRDILPRWGEVSATADGSALETHLSYLTGILRLQLAGTPDGADHVKVQMLDGTTPLNIAGEFKVKLAINDIKQTDACLAVENYTEGTGGTEIVVDLTQASGDLKGTEAVKSVLFVPLVTTSTPVDIVVSASNDRGTTYTEFKRFKNKTVQRGKVYGNSQEYSFATR